MRLRRLQEEIKVAKSESVRYFGSEKLILELYIPHGRHIEVGLCLLFSWIKARFKSLGMEKEMWII